MPRAFASWELEAVVKKMTSGRLLVGRLTDGIFELFLEAINFTETEVSASSYWKFYDLRVRTTKTLLSC
jgi:hypothetical protein